MDKRNQINFILDPEGRQALEKIQATVKPRPTLKALMNYLLVKESAELDRAIDKPSAKRKT